MAKKGIVNIKGKDYQTVGYRVAKFREEFPLWSLMTEIVHHDDKKIIMKAVVISDKNIVVATGHAEEVRGSTNINRTSAVENCETSAIGRALAAFKYQGDDYTIASANEMMKVQRKATKKAVKPKLQDVSLDPIIEFECASKGKRISELSEKQKTSMRTWLSNNDVPNKSIYVSALI